MCKGLHVQGVVAFKVLYLGCCTFLQVVPKMVILKFLGSSAESFRKV